MTTTTDNPVDVTGKPACHDGAFRGRRLSWEEFYNLRPDLRPANDNNQAHTARLRATAAGGIRS